MKLMVPVAGMFVAAGACCCCGGGDMESMLEEMQNQSGGAAMDDIKIEEPSEASGSGGGSVGGGSTEGTCGRFKDDGLTIPSGLSVLSCATMGSTESIVMQGSGAPGEVCKPIKAWATGAGWSVTTEAAMGDTTSIILKDSNNKQLTVACTNMTGQTTVSLSISQGY
jgi:hypothetical protein